VSTAGWLLGLFDLRRCAAGGSFVGDDLLEALDAVLGEGDHGILAEAVDPQVAVFGEHVD
jgi:hypothetical protein